MNRLEKLSTLRVNPAQPISFKYKKKTLQGVSGDTVATALYASGIRIFGRSLKYHRPRGLYRVWTVKAAIPACRSTAFPMYVLKIPF